MRVVLDTNVMVAALVAEGLCREVLHRGVRLRVLAASRPLMDELQATLKRKFRITPAAAAFLKAFGSRFCSWTPNRYRSRSVVTLTMIWCWRRPSGPKPRRLSPATTIFLSSKAISGIEICTPRRFLEQLDAESQ